MAENGEFPPVLELLTKGRLGARRPFPPGPWTEHSGPYSDARFCGALRANGDGITDLRPNRATVNLFRD